jgi:GT2 family glycosyltransferase
MDANPHVAIVIINWNGKSYLRDCLDIINAYTDYSDYRIVVVDNGSDDGSIAMLREEYPDIDLIVNDDNRGFAAANNQAFEQFPDTDYYLLLNNDTEITSHGWLERFVDAAERTDAGITGCRLVFPDGRLQHAGGVIGPGHPPAEHIHAGNVDEYDHDGTEEWRPDYVTGAAFLVRRDVIEGTGGFDERFSPAYFEETDLCVRARRLGYEIVFTPDVEIVHHEGSSTDSYPACLYENKLRFVLLNFPLSWLLIQLPFELRGLAGMVYHRAPVLRVYGRILREIPDLMDARHER